MTSDYEISLELLFQVGYNSKGQDVYKYGMFIQSS